MDSKLKLTRTLSELSLEESKRVEGGENCWCTCHCMESQVVGFQLGMMTQQGAGTLPAPKCTVIFSTIFESSTTTVGDVGVKVP